MLRNILVFFLGLALVGVVAGSTALYVGYTYITRDLPDYGVIEDYRPNAVTRVLSRDGLLMAEFYQERRYPVRIKDVPLHVRQAFLAAEDANFYSHPGIDPVSIARAVIKNIQTGSAAQGGSTITQQVVKNLLLSPERKLKRKIKEAILSYRLEKRLSKDDIFEIYLNQIFFGNSAYGIRSAARAYFRKDVGDLSVAEAAMLAGLPKAPSSYSPVHNLPRAKKRQRYVLEQMVKAGFIDSATGEAAVNEPLSIYHASQQNIFHAPYYVQHIRELLTSKSSPFPGLKIDTDGLEIIAPLDTRVDEMASVELRRGLRVVDKRRGWRGAIAHISKADKQVFLSQFGDAIPEVLEVDTIYHALVTKLSADKKSASIDLGKVGGTIDLEVAWATKRLGPKEEVSWGKVGDTLKVGDVIEVSIVDSVGDDGKEPQRRFQLDQTPKIEGALVFLDPHSGRVLSIQGGYDYQHSQFNRAFSLRQPGSAFKPIVYLAAIDGFGYTPSTIVNDSPRTFRFGTQVWSPGNFDSKFLGPIPLQMALERSRNLVSVEVASRIGLNAVIKYARLLGINSLLAKNLSLSLGSGEVTPLELTRAYGVLPARGILFDSVFVEKITDRLGNIIFDYEQEMLSRGKQVVDEKSAFILAHMMRGVVERGTATSLKALERPVAGKTGTTNDEMDAWFVGFTPKYACGVWVGFDQKKSIGHKETGGRVAAPIFLNFMKRVLDREEQDEYEKILAAAKQEAEKLGIEYVPPERGAPLDFSVPEGVDPIWVNRNNGLVTNPDVAGSILEYFVSGTEPRSAAVSEEPSTESYLGSADL